MAATVRVHCLEIDSVEPEALAWFWSAALECPIDAGASGPWIALGDPNQPQVIMFRHARAPKTAPNRLRLYLTPARGRVAEEVDRLTELGARVIAWRNQGAVLESVMMADPEGNEFYVTPSDATVDLLHARMRQQHSSAAEQ
ncbi:VOC family protein [Actinoallomurus sp. NPDC050550]|uniref:VOC family protein n=1 Tax=Actinoallomurus sp. NPDC050550 TaxID=3154937 RepID=UPI0033EFE5EB